MTAREIIGLVFVIIGMAIVPLGWIVNHKILLLAGLLLVAGSLLFYTKRMQKREQELDNSMSSGNHEPPMSLDINNDTGWQTGGRTESFDSASTSDGDSGGD